MSARHYLSRSRATMRSSIPFAVGNVSRIFLFPRRLSTTWRRPDIPVSCCHKLIMRPSCYAVCERPKPNPKVQKAKQLCRMQFSFRRVPCPIQLPQAFTRAAALLPLRCNGQYISPTYRPTTAQYYCPLCRGPLPASELSRNLGPQ